MPGTAPLVRRRARWLAQLPAMVCLASGSVFADAIDTLVPFRDQIEAGYEARDSNAIEAAVARMNRAPASLRRKDLAAYYTAFARLRQSAIPGIGKDQARNYLDQCIDGLAPLIRRRSDYAQARALNASCLGASATYYLIRAATRGIAAGREMTAALELAPDNPWVVLQAGISDLLTPGMFGGDTKRALGTLLRAEQLFVASRPAGPTKPVFGESETWLYIGRAYVALGHKDRARQALENARSLAPGSADVRDDLAKL